MAKVAVEFGQAGGRQATPSPGLSPLRSRILAQGEDGSWLVEDLVCTAGPQDRPFEEQHSHVAIGIVLSGTFQYRVAGRSRGPGELMTPGSLLLGNAGQYFECGHEHAAGDRCLSFRYAPDYFESVAAEAGAGRTERNFRIPRIPALRGLSPLLASACVRLASSEIPNSSPYDVSWDELSVQVAAQAIAMANGLAPDLSSALPSTIARITRVVRIIENDISSQMSLRSLAQQAKLSPYHFLRSFQQVTGVTPHQYIRRARLRAAATRLKTERTRVLDLALDSGFGDVSNFNRAFHREFGMSPLHFRRSRVSRAPAGASV